MVLISSSQCLGCLWRWFILWTSPGFGQTIGGHRWRAVNLVAGDLISIVIDCYRIVGSWIMVLGKIGAILLMVLVADLVLAASGNFTLCSSVFRWAHYYGMFVWLFTSLGGFVAIFGEFSFKLLFNYYSHCWSIIMKVKQMASVVMLRENVD